MQFWKGQAPNTASNLKASCDGITPAVTFCHDIITTLQDTVTELYRCVTEIKMKNEFKVGRGSMKTEHIMK